MLNPAARAWRWTLFGTVSVIVLSPLLMLVTGQSAVYNFSLTVMLAALWIGQRMTWRDVGLVAVPLGIITPFFTQRKPVVNHRRLRITSRRIALTAAVAAVATVSLAGCATSSDQAAAPREDKVYRTGSNLPTREPTSGDVKTMDPSTLNRPIRSPGSPTTGGGG